MKKETIVWGNALWDPKTLKDANVRITGIYIDSFLSMVTIIRERGLHVKQIKMSMEHAQAIGFINLDALQKYV